MTLQTPVIKSLNPDQLGSVMTFMEQLRQGSVAIGILEAERLRPYLSSLAMQLAKDLKKHNHPKLENIANIEKITALFNAVACTTKNTILSDIIIAPTGIFKEPFLKNKTSIFAADDKFEGSDFKLGFIQVFQYHYESSVSLPIIGLDTQQMEKISPYNPEILLNSFQRIFSSGNHDMQHHYSNTILNSQIAATTYDEATDQVRLWNKRNFLYNSDTDITSFESWLMLNHMRVRRLLEDGPEGEGLRQDCDLFFDELTRIGKEIGKTSEEDAHTAVKYFGAIACFALMRFMPLTQPLFEHAISRWQAADPDTVVSEERCKDLQLLQNESAFMKAAVNNYAAQGITLLPETLDDLSVRKLMIMKMAPWVAHLLSPACPGSRLEFVQNRTDLVGLDLLNSAVENSHFALTDGVQRVAIRNGVVLERHLKNGMPHREDGPAVIERSIDGSSTQEWYINGIIQRRLYIGNNEERREELFVNGCLTRIIETSTNETKEYTCSPNEKRYLQRHVRKVRYADDVIIEDWYNEEKLRHRIDGPASITLHPDGSKTESWYENGVFIRDAETAADGTPVIKQPEKKEDEIKDQLKTQIIAKLTVFN